MDDVSKVPAELEQALVRRRLARAGWPPADCRVVCEEVGRRVLDAVRQVRLQPSLVLDCSAAPASLASPLSELYERAQIVSLDVSPEQLAGLRKRQVRWPWKPRDPGLVCAEPASLPMRDAAIDVLVSNLSLHRRPRPDPVIAEYRRVLAPGGLLMLSSFGPDTLEELRRCWQVVDSNEHVHPFPDMHDLGDALVRAGFHDVVMSAERLTYHYPDVTTLHGDLRRLGVANASNRRPRTLRTPRQVARLTDAYERLRVHEGIPVSVEVVYAHAWKPAPPVSSVFVPFG